jgi:hypothetical protein
MMNASTHAKMKCNQHARKFPEQCIAPERNHKVFYLLLFTNPCAHVDQRPPQSLHCGRKQEFADFQHVRCLKSAADEFRFIKEM